MKDAFLILNSKVEIEGQQKALLTAKKSRFCVKAHLNME